MLNMKNPQHIITEIEIEASPEQVWQVLMDYENLPQWSNGFLGTDKPMKSGEVSTAYFLNPITRGRMEFTHEVVVFEPNHSFGWSGEMVMGYHDLHIYSILPLANNRCMFRQEDGLYGKPSSILSNMMEWVIKNAYNSFNSKLKKRVETLFPAQTMNS